MSLAAYIWAADLPLNLVGPTAYRVLLKYADRADEHGRTAWWKARDLAEHFGCDVRTAQRAVRELRDAGLLLEGDQRHVQHLRGDRRPTVYDLAMRPTAAARFDLGDAADDTTATVTPSRSRYGKRRPNDTATAVAHRTVIEPDKPLSNPGTERYDTNAVPSRPAYGVQPAPRYPRFAPDPPRPAPLPPEVAALHRDAQQLACSAHGGKFTHLFGPDSTCARCGIDVHTILDQMEATA